MNFFLPTKIPLQFKVKTFFIFSLIIFISSEKITAQNKIYFFRDSMLHIYPKSKVKKMLNEFNMSAAKNTSPEYFFQRADIKTVLGDTTGAIQDYTSAITSNPKYFQAYVNRGMLKKDRNQFEAAMKDYNDAIAIEPNNNVVYHNRGFLFYLMKKYSEAIPDFNKSIELDKTTAASYEAKADAQRIMDDVAGGLKTYDDLLRAAPKNFMTYCNRAGYFTDIGDYDAALRDMNTAVDSSKSDPEILIWRSRFFDDVINDNAAAVADCDSAIKKNPSKANYYYMRSRPNYDLKNYGDVIKDCSKAIALDSELVTAYVMRGNVYDLKGMNAEALSDYKAALKINPNDIDSYFQLGIFYVRQNDFKNALKIYSDFLKVFPTDIKGLNQRGNIFMLLKNYKAALKDFEDGLKLAPNEAVLFYLRGTAKDSLKNRKGCCEDMLKSEKLGLKEAHDFTRKYCRNMIAPKLLEAEKFMEEAQKKEKYLDYKSALECYTKVIELLPDSAAGYYDRGKMKRMIGDHAGAIEDYKLSLTKKSDPDAMVSIGVSQSYLGKMDESSETYLQTIKLFPKAAMAYSNLGSNYYTKKEYETAISYFKQATAIQPDYLNAWMGLAESCRESGNIDGACKAYKKIQALGNDSVDMKIILYCK